MTACLNQAPPSLSNPLECRRIQSSVTDEPARRRWFSQRAERCGGSQAIDEMRAEVLPQSHRVVVPWRLVQLRRHQHRVRLHPYARPEDQTVPGAPGLYRATSQPEHSSPTHTGRPVGDIVDKPGEFRWHISPKEALEHPFTELRRGRSVSPVVEASRRLPIDKPAVPALAPV